LPFDPATPTVELVKHIGPAGPGGAAAQLFADANGKPYVAKLKENSQGLRVLANEFCVNKIAHFLEVPAPACAFATFPEPFVTNNASLSATVGNKPVSTGPHFALRGIGEIVRNPSAETVKRAKNKSDAAGIFVLDVLVMNSDRNSSNNLLVLRPDFDPNGIYISAIDHGHCFGSPNWDNTLDQKAGQDHCPIVNELIDGIAGNDPFGAYLERLKGLTPDVVSSITNQLPADWGVSDGERQALNGFLIQRRDKVPEIVNGHKGKFPQWK